MGSTLAEPHGQPLRGCLPYASLVLSFPRVCGPFWAFLFNVQTANIYLALTMCAEL